MNLLVASFCHDWELTGWPVWAAAGTALLGGLATTHFKFPPKAVKLRLMVLFPLIMLIWAGAARFKHLPEFHPKCYYAELDVTYSISIAAVIGFTLAALREPNLTTRICGGVYALASVGLLYEAVSRFIGMAGWFG